MAIGGAGGATSAFGNSGPFGVGSGSDSGFKAAEGFVSGADPGSGGSDEEETAAGGAALGDEGGVGSPEDAEEPEASGALMSGIAGSASACEGEEDDAEEEGDPDDDGVGRPGSAGMLLVSGNFSSVRPPPPLLAGDPAEDEADGNGGVEVASAAYTLPASKMMAAVERSVLVSMFMMLSYF